MRVDHSTNGMWCFLELFSISLIIYVRYKFKYTKTQIYFRKQYAKKYYNNIGYSKYANKHQLLSIYRDLK